MCACVCARIVCVNIMGWPAVVLSGREVGVAEWALSCVLLGGGRVGSCGVGWRWGGAKGMADPLILWNGGNAGEGYAVDARV